MSIGPQFRGSRYDALYTAVFVPLEFAFYVPSNTPSGADEPMDLTVYDEIHLQIANTTSDGSLRADGDLELTVMTADEDLIVNSDGDSVAARCRAQVKMSAPVGDVVCKIVGVSGSEFVLLGKPFRSTVYAGGPTS